MVEGTAVRIADLAELEALAALWKSKLDWDFVQTPEGFGDADGRTALVFQLEPDKVLAFGKGPYSQTRYRFDSGLRSNRGGQNARCAVQDPQIATGPAPA